jgi:hypothetical protein
MPNKTAIRREFTRRIPLPTLAVLRSTASRSALLGLLVLTVSGCGDNAPTPLAPTPLVPTLAPTPPTPTPPPPWPRVEGRVLDEQNQPVQGARVTHRGNSTTADDAGGFSLTVDLPDYAAQWPYITLRVDREGYEAADAVVKWAEAILINMYRSLTISPGESIEITVSLPSSSYLCSMGWYDTNPCRLVKVNSPSGELVDLEVFPADRQKEIGLARAREQSEFAADLPRRLTVAGGDEVWIVVGEPGRVTLRAAGR